MTTPAKTDQTGARSGIVVIDKPAGWTSHQVVGRVRRLAGTRKVGHAGTLDPMATGVLVVGVERATRLLGHLALTDKEYLATIRLGVTTVTDDAEGAAVHRAGAGSVTGEQIQAELGAFRGQIWQVPSAVSAIKIDGVRSYARVRAGEDVALPPRQVSINRLDLLRVRRAAAEGTPVLDLDVLVECSTGTYIRALARDLGAVLDVGGHLSALRRTRVGPFDLAQAHTLDAASDNLTIIDISDVARRCFPVFTLDPLQAQWVRNGRKLSGVRLPADTTALLSGDEFLALYRPSGHDAVPISVFTS